jgi:hypothetical protein
MLEALLRLPLSDTEKATLRAATPLLRGDHWHIGNERLRVKHLSFKTRRYCPNCLAEAPYHRIQWDVVAATHCAVHRVPLVSGGMSWWWPHFDMTPKGESMRTQPNDPVDGDLPFHDLLRTRLEMRTREGDPFPIHDLCDIIAAVRHFALYVTPEGQLVDPVKNKRPNVEAGYKLLTMSHEERVTWFSTWYETVIPASTLRHGFHASSRVGTRYHQGRVGNDVWKAVEAAQYEGFAQVGVLGRKHGKREMARYERTFQEVAAELGVPVKGLRTFVRTLDLFPGRVWNKTAMSIEDAMFEKIKALVGDLITLPQTIAITGTKGHNFRILAKAGYVHEIAGMTIGGVWGPKYLATEVQQLVDRLRASTDQAASAGMKSLGGYARKEGISEGEVLARTMRGELTPTGIDLSRLGLKALYY